MFYELSLVSAALAIFLLRQVTNTFLWKLKSLALHNIFFHARNPRYFMACISIV